MEDLTLYSQFKKETFFENFKGLTIPQYLLSTIEKSTNERNVDWLINSATGESRKFSEFESVTRKIGSSMYKRGLRKGDTVLYMTYDLFYIHVLFVGVWRANGIMRASYPEDDEETLLERVVESRVGWILCEPETAPMCLSVASASQIYWDVEVFVIGEAEGCTSINEILDDDGSELPDCKVSGNDTAIILCTSGTTGRSKGAVHTHYSFLHQISAAKLFFLDGKPNLIASKGTHVTGTVFPLAGLAAGKTVLIMANITKHNLFQAVDTYKPGMIFGFPTFLLLLVNDPEAVNYDFTSLELAVTGGAPVTPAIEEALLQLPNVKALLNTYGLTEGLPFVSEFDLSFQTPTKYSDIPPFSIGRVFAGVKLQIRDIDTESILGPNQRGEIWVKSESLFRCYLNNPEETEKAFTDGWFKTGDVAYYDENEFVFLVDRIKEIFKYYNNHISPTELEDVVSKHPDVAEVCVVGVIDPNGGDRIPRAFVKLKGDIESNLSKAEEIRAFAHEKLVNYKQLRGGLYFIEDFPKGKTGKVSRQLLERIPILPESEE